MKRALSREAAALIPWVVAAVLWFLWIEPMRADEGERLAQQSQGRRDRLKADRAAKSTELREARVRNVLAAACRASSDPATLRQRAVAAAAGLSLSPLTLSVAGGPGGGATIDADGPKASIVELLRRIGNPSQGGFLRSATLREKGARWSVLLTTGVLENYPSAPSCGSVSEPAASEPSPSPMVAPIVRILRPRTTPTPTLALPVMEATPEADPFTLIGFLSAGGRSRASLRVGDHVRVVAAGDVVEGWRCISVDRDEGVALTSPEGRRVVLKPGPSER